MELRLNCEVLKDSMDELMDGRQFKAMGKNVWSTVVWLFFLGRVVFRR